MDGPRSHDDLTADQRRALLAQLLAARRAAPVEHPVSFAQRRLWFLDRLLEDRAVANTPAAWRLVGELDGEALQAALDALVERHESLRTTFVERDGEPRQVVAPTGALALDRRDLSGLDGEARERAWHDAARELLQRPFDLAAGPLLRAHLLRLADDEHVLLMVVHHSVYDGWSHELVRRDLQELYAAQRAGRAASLPTLPIQYGDYAAWQAEQLAGPRLAGLLAAARERLAGGAPVELPGDRARPAVQRSPSTRHAVELPASLAVALEALGRAEGATLFMTVLAALETLLLRLSGQTDQLLGTPVAGRERPETEGLVGCFINTVVLRGDLSGDPTFRTLLGRVRADCLAAFQQAEVPFERLVEELAPRRDLSRNPIFQVLFTLQTGGLSALQPGAGADDELVFEPTGLDSGSTRLDLEVYAFRSDRGLQLVFNASDALFDPATVAAWCAALGRLLQAVADDPDRPLSRLPLLDDAGRRAALGRLVGPPALTDVASVTALVAGGMARDPGALALRWGEQQLTHAELAGRVTRLARQLGARGLGRGQRVGLCLQRGPGLLVALLAVLESGAAYVPLDPAHPAERRRWMVADAGLAALLVDAGADPGLDGAGPAPRLLFLDEHGRDLVDAGSHAPVAAPAADDALDSAADGALAARPGPDDPAYVIYTSGSTGRPKGVVVPHSAAVNLLASLARRPGLTAGQGFVAVTTPSFDIALAELLLPLVVGGHVVLATREQAGDGAALAGLLGTLERGVLQATPSSWRLLLAAGWQGHPGLDAWVGGEGWGWDLARALLSRCASVWNVYGPTETTVWSAARRVSPGDGRVLVGDPLAGTTLHVLDPTGEPVPVGVPGELFIAGAGLATGYHDRPELTAERFVRDPFDPRPGGRLYRTGDAARVRADGSLDVLGRLDDQVKLRGHRIELGEIESALARHADVLEAAAGLVEDGRGEARLAAWIVGRDGSPPEPASLRRLLAEQLPEVMLPSVFVALPSLPRTPNGKLDRRALPDPDAAQRLLDSAHEPARDDLERLLAELWCELLDVERVGRRDRFFELGGHSLLAIRLQGRLRERLSVELPLACFFSATDLAALADALRARLADDAQPTAALCPRPPDAPLQASLQQVRLWFLDRLEPGGGAYNMPVVRRLRGALDVGRLQAAFDQLLAGHDVLRSTYGGRDDEPSVARTPVGAWPLEHEDLSALPPVERERLVEQRLADETRVGFDLARGPLVRARLLRLADDEHVLVWTLHHIVSDARTLVVLGRELERAYAGRDGPAATPARPRLQYADYAHHQRRAAEHGALDDDLAWWRRTLADLPPPLDLPCDFRRPEQQRFEGLRTALTLEAASVKALRRLGAEQGASLFMVLLAAFDTLLMRLTGCHDIVVGSPVSGRAEPALESMVGFFVNTVVLRNDLSGEPRFRELVDRVRDTTLAALEHQQLPFERLVEELAPRRDRSRNPLFQVFVNLLDVGREDVVALEGLDVELQGGLAEVSKFDLGLYLFQRGDELALQLVGAASLFERATLEWLLGQLAVLLRSVAEDPDRPLAALPLYTPEQRARWLAAENEPVDDQGFPAAALERSVGWRFLEQVRRDPARVAVLTRERSWTYAELEAHGAALALALARGVAVGAGSDRRAGPDSASDAPPRVALLLDETAAMATAALAVLRAGCVYVPLDPLHPQAFLASQRDDVEPVAWVCSPSRRALARALAGEAPVHELDLHGTPPAPEGTPPDGSAVDPRQLASIRFTSGSTGRPKGVMQSHRGLLAHIRAYTRALAVVPADRLSALSSFVHDSGLMDVYTALLNGATLCPVDLRARTAEQALEDLVTLGVSVYHSTPTVFRHLLAERPAGEALPDVRLVVFGGEEPRPSDAALFAAHCRADARLVNGLGASESSQGCQAFLDPRRDGARPRLPVGRPIVGTRVVLLDAEGGETDGLGEVGVLSDHVALGYWRRPERTAQVFGLRVPGHPGVRLFRSGDLARRLADGRLEWLGRRDDQLSLRGQRVEPGAAAAALRELPEVADAVVVARLAADGEQRLVAYLVAAAGAACDPVACAEQLRARLPEASVPGLLMLVEGLPRTAGGKLDRRALPAPSWSELSAERPLRPPQGETERRLAALFAEVLGLAEVDTGSDFFALGGHSLLATRVVSRVARDLGVELPLAEMFDRPDVQRLARRIDALREAAAAQGAAQGVGSGTPAACGTLGSARARGASDAAIGRLPSVGDEPGPLSFGQQRFWFLEQLRHAPGAHLLQSRRSLRGALDEAALRWALGALAERQEALRCRFPEDAEGQPCCVVDEPGPPPLVVSELSGLTADERLQRLDDLTHAEGRVSFDLSAGPLWRAHLVRLADDAHELFVSLHHIVADAWSLDLLWRELDALYAARRAGRPSSLATLEANVRQHARWQRERLTGPRLDGLLEWWSAQLAGAPPLLELPTDRPRPAVESMDGARVSRRLEPEVSARLTGCAADHDATLFMLLLAGFGELLRRLGGQDELVVGVPVAGRLRPEFEGLVGLFVNTLPLRLDLSGEPSLVELLGRARSVALDAFERQELPFERLVQALRPARTMSHHPVFQVLLVLQNAPRTEAGLGDAQVSTAGTRRTTSAFDLTLFAWQTADGLVLTAEYKTALFDEDTVAGWLEQLERLLTAAVAAPEVALIDHELLDEAQRARLLASCAAPAHEPAQDTLHELVRGQVLRRGEAPALEWEGRLLSYAELGAASDVVARRLAARGLGPGDRVGVCLRRGPELVVALLGVLGAGAAYVPLDPGHPDERLRHVLGDAGVAALLCDADAKERWAPTGLPLLTVGDAAEPDAASPARPRGATPDDLAYVIYTSGSTGRPKGVEITHRSVVNFLRSMQRRPGITQDDVLLAVTTPAFDIAVLELFGPLGVGGRVVLAPAAATADGLQLETLLASSRATLCQATPATWRLLLEAGWAGDRRLTVLCGGEAWTRELADRLLPRCAALWNLYGPTETTVWSATQQVLPGEQPVAIGAPVDDTRLLVLDERRRLVPPGVPGELAIGGAGLARGYHGQEALTAERFVADPYDSRPGARLYLTGDRVRRRADGTHEFLGRLDGQVKVQGFRIELGEVEASLARCDGLQEAAVAAHAFGPGDVRLVAYVVGRDGAVPDPAALTAELRGRLPDYMLPRRFVPLPALPRTPNGKLDRAALPEPEVTRHGELPVSAAPRSELELLLAELWCEVLELPAVGLHDNFFDLGGHSLLAMRVVVGLERARGVRLNPGELVLQTLGQVAAVAERELTAAPVAAAQAVEGRPAPPRDEAGPSAPGDPPPAGGDRRPLLRRLADRLRRARDPGDREQRP